MSPLSSFLDVFSEEACQRYLHQLRWRDQALQCARCHSLAVRPWGNSPRKPGLKRYFCDGGRKTSRI